MLHINSLLLFLVVSLLTPSEAFPYYGPLFEVPDPMIQGAPEPPLGPGGPILGAPGPPMGPPPMIEPQIIPPPLMGPFGSQSIVQVEVEEQAIGGLPGVLAEEV
ncbi:hypothetical protein GCK32_006997 [Trichostrongylus colubriformis]|uniref:Uncharacterized protein n=1 Tax=Trichostrongylus colubriformis TaxID=6319 RepID=A0AAN8FDT5_TRICO